MNILDPNIESYLYDVIPDRDAVLTEMEKYAEKNNFPIVGPLVGRFLYVITLAVNAKRILELGSGFGYSAYWFAKAVGKDGIVLCTDSNPEYADKAREYFKKGRISNRMQFHVSDALSVFNILEGEFDIIFNDVNKEIYPKVLRKALPRLKKGGLLISDNAFCNGKILEKNPDASAAGVLTYTRMAYASRELFNTIVPIRDGLIVSVKL
ncbi:MAG: O-methyltransferase family protein [C1] [Ignavibacteriae bacterium]|nr:MAG: O-methyltransferase family protein [C1] [Ignavibacteriota bacterium]